MGSSNVSVVYTLGTDSELRLIVDENSTGVTLELLSGSAEIFGSELTPNKLYNFPPSTLIAVITFLGCSLKICGKTQSVNVLTESLMMLPVNLHACLEELRIMAESKNARGPIILVAGPVDCGKTSLCRILLNYATLLGRRPLYIDLNVEQNSVSIPGTLSIIAVDKPADVLGEFKPKASFIYQFGYKNPGYNIALYYLLIKKLGRVTKSWLKNSDKKTRSSGIMIDTCGWISGYGYRAITLAAGVFSVNVLFVIEDEDLYLQLKKDMPGFVKLVYLPKQPDIPQQSKSLRVQKAENRVHDHFYGHSKIPSNPYSFKVKFDDIEIYKVVQSVKDEYVDPDDVATDNVKIINVPFSLSLVNHVFGLSFANSKTQELVLTNISALVCITWVDMKKKFVTVLSKQPEPLASRILIMSDIKLKRKNF